MSDQSHYEAEPLWEFWLPDADRSTGWTNHGYVLQFVTGGQGATPAEAWAHAQSEDVVPEFFDLPESLIAIRKDACIDFEATAER